jgi:hypothetical protein
MRPDDLVNDILLAMAKIDPILPAINTRAHRSGVTASKQPELAKSDKINAAQDSTTKQAS